MDCVGGRTQDTGECLPSPSAAASAAYRSLSGSGQKTAYGQRLFSMTDSAFNHAAGKITLCIINKWKSPDFYKTGE